MKQLNLFWRFHVTESPSIIKKPQSCHWHTLHNTRHSKLEYTQMAVLPESLRLLDVDIMTSWFLNLLLLSEINYV